MRAFHSDETRGHAPRFFLMRGRVVPHEDAAGRVDRLLDGVRLANVPLAVAGPPPREALLQVHTARYLEFLETAFARWSALGAVGPEVIGNVQPRAADARYPNGVVGQAGWHLGDMACPIGSGTAAAAFASAGVAVAAADAVGGGERAAYALCRPPGHHASGEVAGGHCYLSNAAIAAQRLIQHGARVATLDMDVHHGNGTQAIFYDRADVLTVSVHADPNHFYPWFNGHPDERGEGDGIGANLNFALPIGTDDAGWLGAIDEAIARVAQHRPDALVVSAGFDVHKDDPLAGFAVSTAAIGEAAARIAATGLATVIVQEGGYMSDALSRNVAAFLAPFASEARP